MNIVAEGWCKCPCHSCDTPHSCPDCRPLPISWYTCEFCGAKEHECCRTTTSKRRYPMGRFHQQRTTVALQLNTRRGFREE